MGVCSICLAAQGRHRALVPNPRAMLANAWCEQIGLPHEAQQAPRICSKRWISSVPSSEKLSSSGSKELPALAAHRPAGSCLRAELSAPGGICQLRAAGWAQAGRILQCPGQRQPIDFAT